MSAASRNRTHVVSLKRREPNHSAIAAISGPRWSRTPSSALKGQHPGPVDERAMRAHCAPSGSGGARIHVSRSSAWRYTVSATDPLKLHEKSPMSVTPGFEECSLGFRPSVTGAGDTRAAYSPVARRTAVYFSLRICDSTVRKSRKDASLCLNAWPSVEPCLAGNSAQSND